jgi:hypothetical protein
MLLSLLGNRKLHTSMDMLAGMLLLRCMATNSRNASVSIGLAGCYMKKATEKLFSSGKTSEQLSSISE